MSKQASKFNGVTKGEYPSGGVDHISSKAKDAGILTGLEDLTRAAETGLMKMGLTCNEARTYIFLAKRGAKKASELAKLLDFPRTETYGLLNSLQKKGLVSCIMHHPVRFTATPFKSALTALLDMEKQKLISLERQRMALADIWSSIVSQEVTCEEIHEAKFQILEGNNTVYRRIRELVSSAEKEVIIVTDQKQLARLYHSEITDHFQLLKAKGIAVKILTSFELKPEMLKEIEGCEVKMLAESNTNMHYIVIDKTQLVFFIKYNSDGSPTTIWTDCDPIVRCTLCLFEELWKRSSSLYNSIESISR